MVMAALGVAPVAVITAFVATPALTLALIAAVLVGYAIMISFQITRVVTSPNHRGSGLRER
jgi:hypothetical protein